MLYKISIFVLMSIFLLCSPAIADHTASSVTVHSYKYTMTRLQLSQDGGQTFTEVFSGSSQFDITSVTPPNRVGYLCQNLSIPAGTYNYVKIEISSTVPASYEATFPGPVTYYTHPDGLTTTPPAQEQNLVADTTFYEGGITSTEFSENYKRTVYISSIIEISTVTANEGYTWFTLSIPAAIQIGAAEPIQSATAERINLFNFTITASCQRKE